MDTQIHNHARETAEGGPRSMLTWSKDLEEHAEIYALGLALNGRFEHDPNNKTEGENLYWSSAEDATHEEASKAWVDEKKFYTGQILGDGPKPPKERQYGHYTQIIWPDTELVGIASARGFRPRKRGGADRNDRGTYVVARYSPAENIRGQSAWHAAVPDS